MNGQFAKEHCNMCARACADICRMCADEYRRMASM